MIKEHACLALFSGGLDSILSVKLMEKLGYKVTPVFFETPFFEADKAMLVAKANDIKLNVINVLPEYLKILKNPRYGYGRNMNPCVDCHGFMFRKAAELMEAYKADFLISGEVLGQRPKSQRKDAINAVSKLSGVKDLLVRPLCQKYLTDTLPIREGWVDKEEMLDIQGRGRYRQIEMAHEYGIKDFHSPGGGCKLTEIKYSRRLKDIIEHNHLNEQNIRFLNYGRHFRLNDDTKLVVGRNKSDNEHLSLLTQKEIVIKAVDFHGPIGILIKDEEPTNEEILQAARIVLRYNNNVSDVAEVSWGFNYSLDNKEFVEKYSPETVANLMIG
jgi:tRNA-uridine 2-sulfurtransferase